MALRSHVVLTTLACSVGAMAQTTLLDPGFGQGGITHFAVGQAGGDRGEDVVLGPDGRIHIAATRGFQSGSMAAVRLLPDGTLDPSFSADGIASAPMGQYGEARAIALQSDGRVLIGGSAYFDVTFNDLAIARFTTSGALDTTFSGNGRLNIPANGSLDLVRAITALPDGRIQVGGKFDGGTTDMMSLRLLANGDMDPTFGADGIFATTLHTGEVGESMLVRDDGRVLLGGGWRTLLPDADLALFQVDDNGTPDDSFGTSGLFRPSEPGSTSTAITLIGLPDGRTLFLAKRYWPGGQDQDGFVGRVSADGEWDATYGTGGRTLLDVGPPYVGTVRDMVLLSNNKSLVTWDLLDTSNNTTSLMVMRLMPDGGYDASFGTDGKVVIPCPDLGCSVEALAVGADDRVVAVGSQNTPSGQEVMVMKWLENLVPAGVEETRKDAFHVYPVPCRDVITIADDVALEQGAHLQLIDAGGRTVIELTRTCGRQYLIPAEVRNGVYALRVIGPSQAMTCRIVVQR